MSANNGCFLTKNMLNLTKEGTPFARIIGGTYNNKIIAMGSDKGVKQLKTASDAKLQIIPNLEINTAKIHPILVILVTMPTLHNSHSSRFLKAVNNNFLKIS